MKNVQINSNQRPEIKTIVSNSASTGHFRKDLYVAMWNVSKKALTSHLHKNKLTLPEMHLSNM